MNTGYRGSENLSKEGRSHPAGLEGQTRETATEGRGALWTVKFTKAKPQADGTTPAVDIAIPAFGYQNHISIDREHGLIRKRLATDAAAYEGARMREGLLDKTNISRSVWADTTYRSAANDAFMDRHGFVNRVHRKKPRRLVELPDLNQPLFNGAPGKVLDE